MEKSDVVNLIKFHYAKNDEEFYDQSFRIAKDFENNGDIGIARLIESFMKTKSLFVTQSFENDSIYLVNTRMKNPLYLPTELSKDLEGIINSIESENGISKFLFIGQPGTGKTESVKFIANRTKRKLYSVNMSSLINSGLGETLKNIQNVFAKLSNTLDSRECIFLFDELDLIALDRINSNDVREMGRATSLFLKCLEELSDDHIVFATTNLGNDLDKALKRRFDYVVNFDVYNKQNVVDYSLSILKDYKNSSFGSCELSLFKKIMKGTKKVPTPADLRNLIRIAIAFSSEDDGYEYLRRIFVKLYSAELLNDFRYLYDNLGLTVREIEALTKTSKSTISRKLMETK